MDGGRAYVCHVEPGGPADRTNMRVGDVLLILNGQVSALDFPFTALDSRLLRTRTCRIARECTLRAL